MDTYCYGPEHSTECDEKINLKFQTEIKPVIGGGTDDYNELSNRPKINGVVLEGDKTNEELLIVAISNVEIEELLKTFR